MTQDAQKLNGKFAPHNLELSTLVICCLPACNKEQYELGLENMDKIHNNNDKKLFLYSTLIKRNAYY